MSDLTPHSLLENPAEPVSRRATVKKSNENSDKELSDIDRAVRDLVTNDPP